MGSATDCYSVDEMSYFPPRPILADLYHTAMDKPPPGELYRPTTLDLDHLPAPLPHHRYYGGHHHLGRTLDRVTAYDRVTRRVGEGVRSADPGLDLSMNYHPRSWRTPPVDTDDVKKATAYQAENSTVSHILKTYGRSHDLQKDLLHYSTYGMDYHVMPVAE